MKKAFVGVLVVVSFLMVNLGLCLAADYAALIKEGDDWYAQRADLAKAKMAVETFRKATAADQAKAEGWWKLSRALYWVGNKSKSKKEQMVIHEEAIEAAKKATKLAPNDVEGYYWLGVNYGLYGQAKGVLKSLALVDPIKEAMAKVNKINPKYNNAGANMVLGRMYFKLPGIAGGDNDKSIELLQKTVKMAPKNWRAWIYLAEVLKDEDKDAEAKKAIQTAAAGTCGGTDPSCKDDIAEAKKLVKEY